MKKTKSIVAVLLVVILLAACSTASSDPVLTVGEKAYTQADLEALGTISTDYTNKDGETTTYEGIILSALLADAGVTDAGDEVIFIAADGYEGSLTMDEALGCASCIVAFDDGSLRTVMPDMSGKLQVKDLIEIKVN